MKHAVTPLRPQILGQGAAWCVLCQYDKKRVFALFMTGFLIIRVMIHPSPRV